MKKVYVLYNPLSGHKDGESGVLGVKKFYPDNEILYKSLIDIQYKQFFASINEEDDVIICGGDGTLNVFANETQDIPYKNTVLYYATGSGNDFLHDVGKQKGEAPFCINEYMQNLPVASMNGKTYRFINNVGFGIDGYCCEVGDELRAANEPNINYTAIAIKGLLFNYKPTGATITVDGKEYRYDNVWIAPTMKGKYYGGGMMAAPAQDRTNEEVSVVAFYGKSRLRTLMVFPSIFKGEHIKHTKAVAIHTGKNITVRFDSPRTVQVDGETVKNVQEYTVETKVPAKV